MDVLTSTPERRIKHRNQATASAHSIPSKLFKIKILFNLLRNTIHYQTQYIEVSVSVCPIYS